MVTDETAGIDEAAFERASRQGARARSDGPRARTAKYRSGRIHVELDNGCAFAFPAAHAQGLAGASSAQLSDIRVEAAGLGLHWPALDADLHVPALVKGVLGSRAWMKALGTKGGRSTSEAKAEAARTNGRLGGRPRRKQEATME